MKYTQYTIKTTTKDADLVSVLLMDVGICDVQIENNVQLTDEELNQMYADFKKELPEDDGSCDVIFYREEKTPEEGQAFRRELTDLLKEAPDIYGIDPVAFECKDTDSADWENNWKEYFKPFRVDQILIAPTWEAIPDSIDVLENKGGGNQAEELSDPEIIIRIDPGMAFGTGTHETTRLCLRGLAHYIKEGDRVLDLGCGSGILGIGSIKLGASSVTSVDIDEQAVVAVDLREIVRLHAVREHLLGAAAIDDLVTRLVKHAVHTMRDGHGAWHHALHGLSFAQHLSEVVVAHDRIACLDAAHLKKADTRRHFSVLRHSGIDQARKQLICIICQIIDRAVA